MADLNWHVYVGSEVGLLKGVDLERNTFNNICFTRALTKDDEITAMCWEDSSEKKIYIGQRDQTVKVYDCEKKLFPSSYSLKDGGGPIKGLHPYNGQILTGVESGIVKLWHENKEKMKIDTGGNLCRMSANPYEPSHIGTGGEENDLKVWDLQNPSEPVFKAKNVRNDFLDLRVPVWVMDMKFRQDGKIATCTRHHQIRLYDPKAQRRPVIDMEFEKHPLMCLSLAHNEHQIIVGGSRGRMALVDLRKKLLVHVFKGFAGSIRSVQCHPTLPLVASCGLDRFLRIHDLNKKTLLKKIYLKTRLNCLLLKQTVTDISSNIPKLTDKEQDMPMPDAEDDAIWEKMALVKERKKITRDSEYLSQKTSKKLKVEKHER